MIADYFNQFFFGIYPYISFVVWIVGSVFRYDRDPYTWKAGSSQILRKRGTVIANNCFHVGILLLFFGHLVGLLLPHSVYIHVMDAGTKQMFAMVMGGVFGGVCFVGLTMILYRRFFDVRIRATSSVFDIVLLMILYVQLILGMMTIFVSAQHLDGSSMISLANWAQHIVTFQGGAADFVRGQSIIFKLHLILGCTIFLIFPFTRMVHVWSGFMLPLKYFCRSGYQIVRKRGR